MKHHEKNIKTVYTKYDFICIYSKLGVITSTFAAISISLSLFLGFVVTLTGHARLDISSQICLILFVLNLPIILRNVKRYKKVQNKLQRNHPDTPEGIEDVEENIIFKTNLPTKKQLGGCIILLSFLALVILSLCFLMLWLMLTCYENIFLILFVFLGSLSLPVLAVMITYIKLLIIARNLSLILI